MTITLCLQSEDVLVVDLYGEMVSLVKSVMSSFISVEKIKTAESLADVDLDDQLPDSDLFLGTSARLLITSSEVDVTEVQLKQFYQ